MSMTRRQVIGAAVGCGLAATAVGGVAAEEKMVLTVDEVFRDKVEGPVRIKFRVTAVSIPLPTVLEAKIGTDRLHVTVSEKVEKRLNQLGIEDVRVHFYGKEVQISGMLKRVVHEGGVDCRLALDELSQVVAVSAPVNGEPEFKPFNRLPGGWNRAQTKAFLAAAGFEFDEEPKGLDGWLKASKFIGGDDTHHVVRIEFKAGYSVSVMEMAADN